MKFLRLLINVALFLIPVTGHAEDRGSVCLGPNRMSVPYNAEEKVNLTVGDSESLSFLSQDEEPRIVITDLDLNKVYMVKVYNQGRVIESWKLDFRKFKTKLVQIWRSPGYWRMEDACGGACGSLLRCR